VRSVVNEQAPWRIWIDTGGTFTDGVARDPGGAEHRVKILSSSSLRGSVTRRIDATHIEIRESWGAAPGLTAGMMFRLLGSTSGGTRVRHHATTACVLELAEPLDATVTAGASFELLSDEEAPVLAARLLTRTPAGASLPPTQMRLATTLGTNALLQRRGVPTALFITQLFWN
jgi:5-oxoprolinase (ATP-hydrolysing)